MRLLKPRFVNEAEGWVVGTYGTILHTQSGGSIWEIQDSGTVSDLNGISYGGGTSLWIVGNNGTVLKYTDPALIPEPSTLALMGCGLPGLLGISVKRRRKAK